MCIRDRAYAELVAKVENATLLFNLSQGRGRAQGMVLRHLAQQPVNPGTVALFLRELMYCGQTQNKMGGRRGSIAVSGRNIVPKSITTFGGVN